jgi:hypothetical protein
MESFLTEFIKQDLTNKSVLLALALLGLLMSIWFIEQPYAWIGVLATLGVFLVLIFFYRPAGQETEVSSQKWFKTLIAQLDDASSISVYLRSFVHPSEFASKHKDALLRLNRIFVRAMIQYQDEFRLVAYRDAERPGKDATAWLEQELRSRVSAEQATMLLARCVRTIDRQPIGNSSTVYVVDHHTLIYNHVSTDGKARYYVRFLPRSVVPHFVAQGIKGLAGQHPHG